MLYSRDRCEATPVTMDLLWQDDCHWGKPDGGATPSLIEARKGANESAALATLRGARLDADEDGFGDTAAEPRLLMNLRVTSRDLDGDGRPDFLDPDSDNDGLLDAHAPGGALNVCDSHDNDCDGFRCDDGADECVARARGCFEHGVDEDCDALEPATCDPRVDSCYKLPWGTAVCGCCDNDCDGLVAHTTGGGAGPSSGGLRVVTSRGAVGRRPATSPGAPDGTVLEAFSMSSSTAPFTGTDVTDGELDPPQVTAEGLDVDPLRLSLGHRRREQCSQCSAWVRGWQWGLVRVASHLAYGGKVPVDAHFSLHLLWDFLASQGTASRPAAEDDLQDLLAMDEPDFLDEIRGAFRPGDDPARGVTRLAALAARCVSVREPAVGSCPLFAAPAERPGEPLDPAALCTGVVTEDAPGGGGAPTLIYAEKRPGATDCEPESLTECGWVRDEGGDAVALLAEKGDSGPVYVHRRLSRVCAGGAADGAGPDPLDHSLGQCGWLRTGGNPLYEGQGVEFENPLYSDDLDDLRRRRGLRQSDGPGDPPGPRLTSFAREVWGDPPVSAAVRGRIRKRPDVLMQEWDAAVDESLRAGGAYVPLSASPVCTALFDVEARLGLRDASLPPPDDRACDAELDTLALGVYDGPYPTLDPWGARPTLRRRAVRADNKADAGAFGGQRDAVRDLYPPPNAGTGYGEIPDPDGLTPLDHVLWLLRRVGSPGSGADCGEKTQCTTLPDGRKRCCMKPGDAGHLGHETVLRAVETGGQVFAFDRSRPGGGEEPTYAWNEVCGAGGADLDGDGLCDLALAAEAQDRSSGRSHPTRATDHNSSRSNKTSSSREPSSLRDRIYYSSVRGAVKFFNETKGLGWYDGVDQDCDGAGDGPCRAGPGGGLDDDCDGPVDDDDDWLSRSPAARLRHRTRVLAAGPNPDLASDYQRCALRGGRECAPLDDELRPQGLLTATYPAGRLVRRVVSSDPASLANNPTVCFETVDDSPEAMAELDEVRAARKRPGRTKYGDITLKKGYVTVEAAGTVRLEGSEYDGKAVVGRAAAPPAGPGDGTSGGDAASRGQDYNSSRSNTRARGGGGGAGGAVYVSSSANAVTFPNGATVTSTEVPLHVTGGWTRNGRPEEPTSSEGADALGAWARVPFGVVAPGTSPFDEAGVFSQTMRHGGGFVGNSLLGRMFLPDATPVRAKTTLAMEQATTRELLERRAAEDATAARQAYQTGGGVQLTRPAECTGDGCALVDSIVTASFHCVCVTDPCPCAELPWSLLSQVGVAQEREVTLAEYSELFGEGKAGSLRDGGGPGAAPASATARLFTWQSGKIALPTSPTPVARLAEEGGRHTPFHNKYRPQASRRSLLAEGRGLAAAFLSGGEAGEGLAPAGPRRRLDATATWCVACNLTSTYAGVSDFASLYDRPPEGGLSRGMQELKRILAGAVGGDGPARPLAGSSSAVSTSAIQPDPVWRRLLGDRGTKPFSGAGSGAEGLPADRTFEGAFGRTSPAPAAATTAERVLAGSLSGSTRVDTPGTSPASLWNFHVWNELWARLGDGAPASVAELRHRFGADGDRLVDTRSDYYDTKRPGRVKYRSVLVRPARSRARRPRPHRPLPRSPPRPPRPPVSDAPPVPHPPRPLASRPRVREGPRPTSAAPPSCACSRPRAPWRTLRRSPPGSSKTSTPLPRSSVSEPGGASPPRSSPPGTASPSPPSPSGSKSWP